VIADALDELGQRDQAMREYLRPLAPDATFAGWARTIQCQDMFYVPDDPYGLEIEAMDSILPGEVVVVSTCESKRNAPWSRIPSCSFSCACSGTTAFGSSSIRLSVTRSPWIARPSTPSQICCGPSEPTSANVSTLLKYPAFGVGRQKRPCR